LHPPFRASGWDRHIEYVVKATEGVPVTVSAPKISALRSLSSFHRTKLVFLFAAFLSFLLSVWLWFFVDRELGLFVGLWVPSIHSLGTLVLVGERT